MDRLEPSYMGYTLTEVKSRFNGMQQIYQHHIQHPESLKKTRKSRMVFSFFKCIVECMEKFLKEDRWAIAATILGFFDSGGSKRVIESSTYTLEAVDDKGEVIITFYKTRSILSKNDFISVRIDNTREGGFTPSPWYTPEDEIRIIMERNNKNKEIKKITEKVNKLENEIKRIHELIECESEKRLRFLSHIFLTLKSERSKNMFNLEEYIKSLLDETTKQLQEISEYLTDGADPENRGMKALRITKFQLQVELNLLNRILGELETAEIASDLE